MTTTKAIGGVVIAVVALLGVVFFTRSSSGSSSPPEISVADVYASQSTSDGASAMYMTIQNNGGSDHLVGVIAGGAGTVTIHDAAMAPQARLAVKGHGDTKLAPGGNHIMLENLERPLNPGAELGVRLLFDRSAPVDVTAQVLSYDQVNAKVGA
jgi:periplasmic copper chaperone A